MKIVLIEGLPGSGKSTVASFIRDEFVEGGKTAKLYLETDVDNPFRFRDGTQVDTDANEFVTGVEKIWRELVLPRCDSVVQESMTFQQQVNYLIWVDRLDLLDELMDKVFVQLRKFDLHLIYLNTLNPVENFRQTMAARGETWVSEKVAPIAQSPFAKNFNLSASEIAFKFIEKAHFINHGLLKKFPFPKTVLDVSDRSWPKTQNELRLILAEITSARKL